MAMHEFHDEDLILDLLDAPAVTDADASARLDGCTQCLADYTEQRSIVDMLSRLDTPTLTARERSALHSAVFSELGSRVVVPLEPRRSWNWTRLGTVAAALVGVVAVAGLFSILGFEILPTWKRNIFAGRFQLLLFLFTFCFLGRQRILEMIGKRHSVRWIRSGVEIGTLKSSSSNS